MRLARVGYDNTLGYLSGGIEAWKNAEKETDSIQSIPAAGFAEKFSDNLNVLDVRRPGEYETEHIENAENKPLDFINDWMPEVNRDKEYFVHCAGGYRSMVAASILKARGFENIIEVAGGYGAISKTNVPKTNLIHSR